FFDVALESSQEGLWPLLRDALQPAEAERTRLAVLVPDLGAAVSGSGVEELALIERRCLASGADILPFSATELCTLIISRTVARRPLPTSRHARPTGFGLPGSRRRRAARAVTDHVRTRLRALHLAAQHARGARAPRRRAALAGAATGRGAQGEAAQALPRSAE